MESPNFLPLKSLWPQLYEHACFAERYVYTDPNTAAIKLRCFAETLVGILYRELRLHGEPTDGFFEKLKSPVLQEVVGDAVLQKLHALRMLGNGAAHGCGIDTKVALSLIEEAHLIGEWFYKSYNCETLDGYPPYTVPGRPPEHPVDAEKAEKYLAGQLAAAKEELSRLEEVEKAAQAEIASLNQTLDEAKLRDFKNSSVRASRSIDFRTASKRRLIRIHDAFAGYSLTDGQSELVDRLERFLSSDTESVFFLKGYAGTGKTFITKGLTEYFRSIGRNYVLAAPTGKAAKVIGTKTKSPAYTIHKTIYSFDDIAEYRDDGEDGTETFKFYFQLAVNSQSADTVYIVDEASMIADVYQEAEFFRFGTGYLLADFLKFVNLDHNDHSKKVIFIGDDAQLPPVGMNFSPALDADYLFQKHHARSTGFELSEVVRQKLESGVIANAIPLRKALQSKVFDRLVVDLDHSDVNKVEHKDLIARYLEACGGKINEESMVIAHSNSDVADYNRAIRQHFFPGCDEVMPEDKVMAVANNYVYGVLNGDFGLIRQVFSPVEKRTVTLKRKAPDSGKIEEIPVSLRFIDVEVDFRDVEGVAHIFQAKIMENLLYSKAPALSSDQNKALYLDFCIRNKGLKKNSNEFKATLRDDSYFNALRLKFGYAITCHKAQGSEWNHVFVKCKSHQSQLTADYFRWFYTAITRTVKNLHLLDPPNLKPWSNIKIVSNPAPPEMLRVRTPQEISPDAPACAGSASPAVVSQDADTYGIPASASFLLSVLSEVRKLIAGKGIVINDVFHNQYQEAYHFRREGEFARIDIAYNGKSKITSVTAPQLTDLGAELVGILTPLKGLLPFAGGVPSAGEDCFAKPFLNDFHQKVLSLCGEGGIVVKKVVEQQWAQRYYFSRAGEVAVYDIWYNGRDQFSRCQPLITACSPGTLVSDVGLLLTEGMRG